MALNKNPSSSAGTSNNLLMREDSNLHKVVSQVTFNGNQIYPFPIFTGILTPETGGHGCQFRHPSLLLFVETNVGKWGVLMQIIHLI